MKKVLNQRLKTDGKHLRRASRNGYLDVVQSLIAVGVDVNDRSDLDYTPLHLAVQFGRPEVAQYLIEQGADVNAKMYDGCTPLLLAAGSSQGHHSCTPMLAQAVWRRPIVQLLLESGADVNCRSLHGDTVLHYASRAGWLGIVKDVISKGGDVNATNDQACLNYTPLHYAAEGGWLEIVRYLIEKGAAVDSQTLYEKTPLLLAAPSHEPVVELLINLGANQNIVSSQLWTLLHYASKSGWINVVQSQIKKNVDVNARTSEDYTPLYLASKFLKINIIKDLLIAGADSNLEIKLDTDKVSIDEEEDCDLEEKVVVTPFGEIINQLAALTDISNTPFNIVEVIGLYIQYGAYIRIIDYSNLLKNSILKVGILQDVNLCTQAILNQFCYVDLPKLYELPLIENLALQPRIKKMIAMNISGIEKEIKLAVKYKLQTKGHCNVLKTSPIVLSVLCIKSLLNYY